MNATSLKNDSSAAFSAASEFQSVTITMAKTLLPGLGMHRTPQQTKLHFQLFKIMHTNSYILCL